jgi:hypothetical protein
MAKNFFLFLDSQILVIVALDDQTVLGTKKSTQTYGLALCKGGILQLSPTGLQYTQLGRV